MNLLLIRLIIFAVLFFAGLKLYRMYREWKLEQEGQRGEDTQQEGRRMVRCAWCQVHVPETEALRDKRAEEWFCCSAHRDRYLEERKPGE